MIECKVNDICNDLWSTYNCFTSTVTKKKKKNRAIEAGTKLRMNIWINNP